MSRDPVKNFETLWKTFNERYPFFELRNVDWQKQYETYRPRISRDTTDDDLFDILCQMLSPLNDGHVDKAKARRGRKKRVTLGRRKRLGSIRNLQSERSGSCSRRQARLLSHGFGKPKETEAWMLHYCRSPEFGYMRILELEGIGKRKLTAALDKIARDFQTLKGMIIDIRDNPGGDDSTVLSILNRFCDRKRTAFHRKTKTGPAKTTFRRSRPGTLNHKATLNLPGRSCF